MGWRFRKSISLGKNFHINLSKSGPSFSFGRPGAHITVGKRSVTKTVGLPGTGVYHTDTTPWNKGYDGHKKSGFDNDKPQRDTSDGVSVNAGIKMMETPVRI